MSREYKAAKRKAKRLAKLIASEIPNRKSFKSFDEMWNNIFPSKTTFFIKRIKSL